MAFCAGVIFMHQTGVKPLNQGYLDLYQYQERRLDSLEEEVIELNVKDSLTWFGIQRRDSILVNMGIFVRTKTYEPVRPYKPKVKIQSAQPTDNIIMEDPNQ